MFLRNLGVRCPKFSIILTFLLLETSIFGAFQEEKYSELKDLEIKKRDSQLEIIIKLSKRTQFKVFRTSPPSTIVFEIFSVGKISADSSFKINDLGLRQIRIARVHPYKVHVLFEVFEEFPNFRVEEVQNGLKLTLWLEKKIEKEEKKKERAILENTFIELGYGRYDVSDTRYKEVYQRGDKIYTLEIHHLLQAQNLHHFGISIALKRFVKKGQSTVTQEKTQLFLMPIVLGFKYLFKAGNFIPWIEIGMDLYKYKESSNIKTTSSSTFGYHIQGGLYFQIPKIEFIKLKIYAKHTKATTKENNIEVNLGGLEYGLGLAFSLKLF